MKYTISKPDSSLRGDIRLDGSKSISNRVLIIRALCGEHFDIHHLSTSKDTETLERLLASADETLDAGAAGTTFRFLTAYLATQPGSHILTGSERMKQRPIGALSEALKILGADLEYLEREGFPPIRIGNSGHFGTVTELGVAADTSSQFVSALLMIAPTLPQGLTLEMQGEIVSQPYILMTLGLMAHFGVHHSRVENRITVPHQTYQPRSLTVESDWSAASYYYAMAAFSEDCDLRLHGLQADSFQGDSVLPGMMESFGVQTVFHENFIQLKKSGQPPKPIFEQDFNGCPDLAQTLAVTCAGLGVQGLFTGLETLYIKETDRVLALKTELKKVKSYLGKLPANFSKKSAKTFYLIENQAIVTETPLFATYEDHRMAMAFAPLAMLGDILIEHPQVVEKSYPAFWKDLQSLGFLITVDNG